ncbi:unnamed protein product [Tetraodon nigroviridis]|uniref:(spotted green pufferfish) hypothetical protein n=1 Tax=Tetraodon nigroviridis TaxID=99883 RepID=Q4S4U3_TETNG|nr:unnamed protein product [Tetraodon nigroviridis]
MSVRRTANTWDISESGESDTESQSRARERQRAARAQEKEERRREQRSRREAAESLKSLRPENYLRSLTVGIDPAGRLRPAAGHPGHSGLEVCHRSPGAPSQRHLEQSLPGGRLMIDRREEESGEGSATHPLLEALNREPRKVVTVLLTESHPDSLFLCTSRSVGISPWSSWATGRRSLTMCVLSPRPYQRGLTGSGAALNRHRSGPSDASRLLRFPSRSRLLTERPALPFCLEGSWASGVRVERDGSGLVQVWRSQLQQLNRVSSAAASAVTTAYPSPQLLLQAYWALAAEAERKGLLAGLLVRSGDNERRLGPEMSARIYRYLTAQNPQLVLD